CATRRGLPTSISNSTTDLCRSVLRDGVRGLRGASSHPFLSHPCVPFPQYARVRARGERLGRARWHAVRRVPLYGGGRRGAPPRVRRSPPLRSGLRTPRRAQLVVRASASASTILEEGAQPMPLWT